MIARTVTLISLNLTLLLVQGYNVVARTLTVNGATATTPIALSVPAHGFPTGRPIHGVVTGIAGTVEANGLWILTPTDSNTFALSAMTAQGLVSPSVGTNAYVSGGQIQIAFPDGSILLGRRNVELATAVTTPRIVFVPTDERAWNFDEYGGEGAAPPQELGTLEQQAQKLQPQLATCYPTFFVFVTGAANPPSPDFGDFEATEMIRDALYSVLFDLVGGLPRARFLRAGWPSQRKDAGVHTQRGQMWCGVLEMQQGITKPPVNFVPPGTSLVFTVEPESPLVPDDQTTFTVSPPPEV